MPTILETPQSLCRREGEAREVGKLVALEPDTVRQIAESWHADILKIKYLEGLIVRMGRGDQVADTSVDVYVLRKPSKS